MGRSENVASVVDLSFVIRLGNGPGWECGETVGGNESESSEGCMLSSLKYPLVLGETRR